VNNREMVNTATVVALLAGLLWFGAGFVGAQGQNRCPEVEQYPDNLIYNCSFERGWLSIPLGEIGEGWEYSIQEGQPALDHSTFERLHGNTAQRIWTDGVPFSGSIYQRVDGVMPGMTYVAVVDWAAISPSMEANIGRKVGIDPLGGTDPASAKVVWSPYLWTWGHDFSTLRVSAVAEATAITVFVEVDVPSSAGKDEAFIDLVRLEADYTQTPATATPVPPSPTLIPTATPVPPTATPTPLPPTATPSPTDTPSPTATATPESTETPRPADTATPTSVPSAPVGTAEMTAANVAPVPTATAQATLLPSEMPAEADSSSWIPPLLLALAAFSFAGAAGLGIVLILLRRP
jgi:hypothetical protein